MSNNMIFPHGQQLAFAKWSGVNVTTVNAWKKSENPPAYAIKLYDIWQNGLCHDVAVMNNFADMLEEVAKVLRRQ